MSAIPATATSILKEPCDWTVDTPVHPALAGQQFFGVAKGADLSLLVVWHGLSMITLRGGSKPASEAVADSPARIAAYSAGVLRQLRESGAQGIFRGTLPNPIPTGLTYFQAYEKFATPDDGKPARVVPYGIAARIVNLGKAQDDALLAALSGRAPAGTPPTTAVAAPAAPQPSVMKAPHRATVISGLRNPETYIRSLMKP